MDLLSTGPLGTQVWCWCTVGRNTRKVLAFVEVLIQCREDTSKWVNTNVKCHEVHEHCPEEREGGGWGGVAVVRAGLREVAWKPKTDYKSGLGHASSWGCADTFPLELSGNTPPSLLSVFCSSVSCLFTFALLFPPHHSLIPSHPHLS